MCQTESSNNQYCQTWRITQEEVKKCKPYERQVSWPYVCQYYTDNGYVDYNVEVEYEYADCKCLERSRNGNFCYRWYCREWSHKNDVVEDEYYTCKHNDASQNVKYCKSWCLHA